VTPDVVFDFARVAVPEAPVRSPSSCDVGFSAGVSARVQMWTRRASSGLAESCARGGAGFCEARWLWHGARVSGLTPRWCRVFAWAPCFITVIVDVGM
jgi:hypothetical protein